MVHTSSLSFDDNKILKNNWITNICSSVQEHMKGIRKRLKSLEDHDGRSTRRSSKSHSRHDSHMSWGVTSTDSVKDINIEAD